MKKSWIFLISFVIVYIIVLFFWWELSWMHANVDYENGGSVTYWFPDVYVTVFVVILGILGCLVFYLLRRKE